LKSVLADLGVVFERTHNLAYLTGLLEDRGVAPPPATQELVALTPWATGFRYEDVGDRALDRSRVLQLVQALRRWAVDQRAAGS
jgi:hypothetical protein